MRRPSVRRDVDVPATWEVPRKDSWHSDAGTSPPEHNHNGRRVRIAPARWSRPTMATGPSVWRKPVPDPVFRQARGHPLNADVRLSLIVHDTRRHWSAH